MKNNSSTSGYRMPVGSVSVSRQLSQHQNERSLRMRLSRQCRLLFLLVLVVGLAPHRLAAAEAAGGADKAVHLPLRPTARTLRRASKNGSLTTWTALLPHSPRRSKATQRTLTACSCGAWPTLTSVTWITRLLTSQTSCRTQGRRQGLASPARNDEKGNLDKALDDTKRAVHLHSDDTKALSAA